MELQHFHLSINFLGALWCVSGFQQNISVKFSINDELPNLHIGSKITWVLLSDKYIHSVNEFILNAYIYLPFVRMRIYKFYFWYFTKILIMKINLKYKLNRNEESLHQFSFYINNVKKKILFHACMHIAYICAFRIFKGLILSMHKICRNAVFFLNIVWFSKYRWTL